MNIPPFSSPGQAPHQGQRYSLLKPVYRIQERARSEESRRLDSSSGQVAGPGYPLKLGVSKGFCDLGKELSLTELIRGFPTQSCVNQ